MREKESGSQRKRDKRRAPAEKLLSAKRRDCRPRSKSLARRAVTASSNCTIACSPECCNDCFSSIPLQTARRRTTPNTHQRARRPLRFGRGWKTGRSVRTDRTGGRATGRDSAILRAVPVVGRWDGIMSRISLSIALSDNFRKDAESRAPCAARRISLPERILQRAENG